MQGKQSIVNRQKRNKAPVRLLPLLLLGLLSNVTFSCTTSRGSAYEETGRPSQERTTSSENESSESIQWSIDRDEDTPSSYALVITSAPDSAAVYIDGDFMGRTPFRVYQWDEGRYSLTLEKEGYKTLKDSFYWTGPSQSYHYSMTEITGFLDVDLINNRPTSRQKSPLPLRLSIAGQSWETFPVELPIGRYLCYFEIFGHQSLLQYIVIKEEETTWVTLDSEPLPLGITDITLTPRRFNPENPGLLNSTILRFRVTGPGAGRVTLIDEQERRVFSQDIPSFDGWEQSLRLYGDSLPDGDYRVLLEASDSGGPLLSFEKTMTVDRSLIIRYRSLFSGCGFLFTPSPEALPAGNFQSSIQFHAHSNETFSILRAPLSLGFRFGLGSDWEGILAGKGLIDSRPATSSLGLSLLIKKEVFPGGALFVRGAYQGYTDYWGLQDNYPSFGYAPGLSAGAALGGRLGILHGLISWEGGYALGDLPFRHRVSTSLFLERPLWNAGVSASLPLDSTRDLPLMGGLSGGFNLPGTPLFLSASGVLHYYSASSYFGEAGLGLSLLF